MAVSASTGPVPTSAEFEMPLVQQPTPQQLAGGPATAKPSCGHAVEELPDRSPLANGYAGVQSRILGTKSGFAPRIPHQLATMRLPMTSRSWFGVNGSRRVGTPAGVSPSRDPWCTT